MQKEDITFRVVDGRRVQVAQLIKDSKSNQTRLDAPYGYKKNIDFGSGILDKCIVYVTMDISSTIERYATVSHPDSDKLVSFRCKLLHR
jgi:hypothetical protein